MTRSRHSNPQTRAFENTSSEGDWHADALCLVNKQHTVSLSERAAIRLPRRSARFLRLSTHDQHACPSSLVRATTQAGCPRPSRLRLQLVMAHTSAHNSALQQCHDPDSCADLATTRTEQVPWQWAWAGLRGVFSPEDSESAIAKNGRVLRKEGAPRETA